MEAATSVALPIEHIVVSFEMVNGVGDGLTVTVTDDVVAHPALGPPVASAVTEYVVVVEGETETEAPTSAPGVHV